MYSPITDLPANWLSLANHQLKAFHQLWQDQRDQLKDNFALKKFNQELMRRWVFETGAIEGLYDLDYGTTETLIEQGINAAFIPHSLLSETDRERLLRYLNNQQNALNSGIDGYIQQNKELSLDFIKNLHLLMTQNQDLIEAVNPATGEKGYTIMLKGSFKLMSNNSVTASGHPITYCPPDEVINEMEHLLAFHAKHMQQQMPPEIMAAFLHHRFTQIHPFQDGNGRMARLLASLVFIKTGGFPLVISVTDRPVYTTALEMADAGDLSVLVRFFATLQIKAFQQAIKLSEEALTGDASLEEALNLTLSRVLKPAIEKHQPEIFTLSDHLQEKALQIFQETGQTITQSLTENQRGEASVKLSRDTFYEATYIDKVSLNINLDGRNYTHFDLTLNFSARQYRVNMINMEIRAYFFGAGQPRNNSLSDEPFTFIYTEKLPDVVTRFEQWLKKALALGIVQWGKIFL